MKMTNNESDSGMIDVVEKINEGGGEGEGEEDMLDIVREIQAQSYLQEQARELRIIQKHGGTGSVVTLETEQRHGKGNSKEEEEDLKQKKKNISNILPYLKDSSDSNTAESDTNRPKTATRQDSNICDGGAVEEDDELNILKVVSKRCSSEGGNNNNHQHPSICNGQQELPCTAAAAAAAAAAASTMPRHGDVGEGTLSLTTLDRSSEMQHNLPGAFMGMPSGNAFQRAPRIPFSMVGASTTSSGSDNGGEEDLESAIITATPSENNNNNNADSGAVPVANPVAYETDTNNLPRAERFHNGHSGGKDPRQWWKRQSYNKSGYCRRSCCYVVLLVLVLMIIVLAVLLSMQREEYQQSEHSSNATIAPTTSSATALSVSPDDYVLSLLPAYTKQSIMTMNSDDHDHDRTTTNSSFVGTTTPQGLAYSWILKDPNLLRYTNNTIVQRFALGTLYYATGGDQWFNNTNWLSYNHHECEWAVTDLNTLVQQHPTLKPFHSVQYYLNYTSTSTTPCGKEWDAMKSSWYNDNNDGHHPYPGMEFRHLWLQKNNLRGPMPLEVYLLTNLQSVWIFWNNMEGSMIPTQIGKLTNLELYSVGASEFGGRIPTQVGLLTNLHTFHTATAKSMVGTIPSEIGRLTNLVALALDESQHTGTIPTQLGALGDTLELLLLYDNKLTGQIPSQLGLLTNLQNMKLERNELTGPTPSQLDLLAPQNNGSLVGLHLEGNQLSGTLSDQLCDVGINVTCTWFPTFQCNLYFDCSEIFCGCDCPCG